jgi:tetratricopeptide (TPR) repeat protein
MSTYSRISSYLFASVAFACALPSLALAQRYVMRDGTVLPAADVTLGSGALVQQVNIASGGSFERRFPFGDIARLEFPEPEGFEEADTLIRAGKGTEALAVVEPIYRQFAPFSRLPGSHWPRAANLRLQALLLGNDNLQITAAAREIMQANLGPEITGTAKLALAQLDARGGRESLANIMIDEIVREAPAPVQARAWLLRGDLAAARSSHVEALEAYLRIPAFFGTLDELLPHALLGAARAYKGYGDSGRAERAAIELIDNYPETAQAALAKREFGL